MYMELEKEISPDLEKELDMFIDLFSDEPNISIDGGNYFTGACVPLATSTEVTICQKNALKVVDQAVDQMKSNNEDEICEAEETYYNKISVIENAEKRARPNALPPPKILKNDIRRYYSKMFMNTINSADFGNIQSFFNTFMPWPSKFIAMQDTTCEFQVPPRIVVDGPRQMGHYLLGCFVQYPDMTLSMKDCSIITSTGWSGTRIVMNMEVNSTKIYNLEMDEWIPQLATLDKTYQRAIENQAIIDASATKQTITTTSAASATVVDAEAHDNNISGLVAALPQLNTATTSAAKFDSKPLGVVTPRDSAAHCAAASASGRGGGNNNGSGGGGIAIKKEKMKVSPKNGRGRPRNNENPNLIKPKHKSSDVASSSKKRKVGSGQNKGVLEGGEGFCPDEESCADIGTVCSNVSESELIQTHIPEAFVHGLFSHAQLLPSPIKLVLSGTITFFLDENNHMQHMALQMKQTNR